MDSSVSDKERDIALKLCNAHLGGVWKDVSINQVEVFTVSGGMTNLLYRCALKENVKLIRDEPRQVLLRIYGPSSCNIDRQVRIFNRLANAGLGPRLHSTFDKGRFEEYLPSSPLSWNKQTDVQISGIIARKIAAIHRLDVQELDKTPNWLVENYHRMFQIVSMEDLNLGSDVSESTRNIACKMMEIDLESEISYIQNLFERSRLPFVFSHNDLHQNNIIFLDHQDDKNLDERVVLIDFEYCSYNYLTFDLANHLSEWCFDYVGDEYPNFSFSLEWFPSDEKQRQFLTHYVEAFKDYPEHRRRLFGPNLSNSDIVDLLHKEMQTFLMASNLLWCIWAIQSALTSKIKFGYWEMSKNKWDVYTMCKKRFQTQNQVNGNNYGGETFRLQPSKM